MHGCCSPDLSYSWWALSSWRCPQFLSSDWGVLVKASRTCTNWSVQSFGFSRQRYPFLKMPRDCLGAQIQIWERSLISRWQELHLEKRIALLYLQVHTWEFRASRGFLKTREDQAHLSASSLGTVITRWIFFNPPCPTWKDLKPLLHDLVLFCKKKKVFFGGIVRECSVGKEIPKELAACKQPPVSCGEL